MAINAITSTSDYPWELLLLADPDRAMIEHYLETSCLYGYDIKEKIVGVIAVQMQGAEQAEIMNLAVAEEYQGQGIGRQLLRYTLSQVKASRIIIKTGDVSGPALNLYKSLGFEVVEIVENYFVDHYPEPIYEEGQLLKHQVILEKKG